MGDVGDIIRMHINENVNPYDLPNLAKSTHYMRSFKYSQDIYSHIHATASTMLRAGRIPEDVRQLLTQIYTEHGMLSDSPFVDGKPGN